MAKSKKQTQIKKVKSSRAKNLSQPKTFFTSNTRQAFIKLRQIFVEVLILNYFDLKHYVCIEINTSSYAINKILN